LERTKGVVPTVIDSGQCGSSVVYSEGLAVASCGAIKTGKIILINFNQLIACATKGGCSGFVDGGVIYNWIVKCGAPTNSGSFSQCQYNQDNAVPVIDGFGTVQSGNETALAVAIAEVGPAVTSVDASHPSFQFYSGGVYYEPSCSATNLDHQMLVVGYDERQNNQFWTVQNSWGTSWGIQGYILMSRNRNNNCGIASEATYPVYGKDKFHPDGTCNGN